MFYADYADNCVFCVMYLRNVADYAEIQVFTHFYAIKSITQYSGGGVRTGGRTYPPSRVLRNDGQFLRKVWISNLLRNINFYSIKTTRLRNLLRKCFGQASSSPASWFAPCCCAMGILNFFCLSPDPAPLENIWWQFRISSQAVPS